MKLLQVDAHGVFDTAFAKRFAMGFRRWVLGVFSGPELGMIFV
jgi:hypothetical protein